MSGRAVYFFAASLVLLMACSSAPESVWTRADSRTADHLHNGFFIDDQNGWIVSYGTGRLLHTADGGDTWSVQSQLDSIFWESIFFTSPKEGWICGENGSLSRTDDGGDTWRRVAVAPATVAFYGISFPGPRRGILVGIDVTRRNAACYTSDDGGETWQAHPDSFACTSLEPIQFFDEKTGVMAGGERVFFTTDGGVTWNPSYVDAKLVIRGLHFLDHDNGWVVGHRGAAFQTHDGGLSWHNQGFTANRLRSVYFVDERNGFVVGDRDQDPASLWFTRDGGRTWKNTEDDYPDLHRLIKAPDALWAVGKSGTILRYRL